MSNDGAPPPESLARDPRPGAMGTPVGPGTGSVLRATVVTVPIGYADGITRSEFRARFVGRSTDRRLRVARGGGSTALGSDQIMALTAATVSSRSVCRIVNDTIADVRPLLATAAEEGP